MNEKPKRRLCEAIRAGAAKRPQGFGGTFCHSPKGIVSCAIGAAYEGASGNIKPHNSALFIELSAMFPILRKEVRHASFSPRSLFSAIVELNDTYRWTREEIADFVERVEAEEAAKEMQIDRFIKERDPEPVLQH